MEYVQSITYRQGWVRHLLPHLKASKGGVPAADAIPEKSQAEQEAFIDQLCGGRVYEGEKWWLPLLEKTAAKERERDRQMEVERMRRMRGK